jgi:hypothetical protein
LLAVFVNKKTMPREPLTWNEIAALVGSFLIIAVIAGMLVAIIVLSLNANCFESDIECQRNRDRRILIRDILGYIFATPIALIVLGIIIEQIWIGIRDARKEWQKQRAENLQRFARSVPSSAQRSVLSSVEGVSV